MQSKLKRFSCDNSGTKTIGKNAVGAGIEVAGAEGRGEKKQADGQSFEDFFFFRAHKDVAIPCACCRTVCPAGNLSELKQSFLKTLLIQVEEENEEENQEETASACPAVR